MYILEFLLLRFRTNKFRMIFCKKTVSSIVVVNKITNIVNRKRLVNDNTESFVVSVSRKGFG